MRSSPNPSIKRTGIRALRGSRPLISNRWRGASRRPLTGRELDVRPVSGAAPANRSFNRTIAGYQSDASVRLVSCSAG